MKQAHSSETPFPQPASSGGLHQPGKMGLSVCHFASSSRKCLKTLAAAAEVVCLS